MMALVGKKKGQAAMEFLTTYGWAVLVIAIVLVALAWLGIFNVQGQVPDRCTFQAGIKCVDVRIGSSGSPGISNKLDSLIIENQMAKTIYVCGYPMCGPDLETVNQLWFPNGIPGQCTGAAEYVTPILPGESKQIQGGVFSCYQRFGGVAGPSVKAVGEKFSGKVVFYYSLAEDAGTAAKARAAVGDVFVTIQAR